MEKQEQASLVQNPRLGKRHRHGDKTSKTLPQRVMAALHVGGFARLFSSRSLLLLRDDSLLCRPEEGFAVPLAGG